MPRYNIYLKKEADDNLNTIFEHLKKVGEIPANASEIGDYRAQCISYALEYAATLNSLGRNLLTEYQSTIREAGVSLGVANVGDSLVEDVLWKIIELAKKAKNT